MSRTIDNRVVHMQFDNVQFLQRAQASFDALNNIDAAISGMSGKDLQSIAQNVDKTNSKLGLFGAIGFTAIQKATGAAIDFGVGLARNVVEPLTGGGMRRALNFEQARFQFRGLGMDVEASMESANQAVLGTAYGLDEAARLASMLGASGMQAGDEMTESLRGVAGVAAMSGSSFMDIGDIFSNVAGKGRAMTEDFNRLSSRGINGFATLAEHLDTTEEEVRKLATAGKIDFKLFSEAMAGAFGEHATKANETYTGSLSNMRAALGRIGGDFASIKLTNHRDMFNALTPVINAARTALEPLVQLYQDFTTTFTGKAVMALGEMVDPVLGLRDHFQVLADIVRVTKSVIDSIVAPIRDAFNAVFDLGSVDFSGGLLRGLEGFEDFVRSLKLSTEQAEVLRTVMTVIFEGVALAIEGVKVAFDILLDVGGAVKDFFTKFNEEIGVLERVQTLAENLLEAVTGVQGGFDGLKISLEGAAEALADVVNRILDGLEDVISWFQTNVSLDSVLIALFGAGSIEFLRRFAEAVREVYEVIKGEKEGSGFFAALKDGFSQFTEGATATLDALAESLSAFTGSIRSVALLLIATALLTLAVALEKLSQISIGPLLTGLGAIAILFGLLGFSFKNFNKTLGLGSSGLVTGATSILLISFAIKNMADAVIDLGSLDAGSLAKGVIALSTILLAVGAFMRIGSKQLVPLASGASIWIVAQALGDIVDAVAAMAAIDVEHIDGAMIDLITILSGISLVLVMVGKVAPVGSVLAAAALLIAVQALEPIVDALTELTHYDPEKIADSMLLLTGALFAVGGVISAMGLIAPVGAVISATAILIAVQSLEPIVDALTELTHYDPVEIAESMLLLTGALFAVGGVISAMGLIAPIGSFIAGAALLVAVQSLEPIVDALTELTYYDPVEIAESMLLLTGMLFAVGGVISAVGLISPVGSIFGGAALLVAVQSLEPIVDALAELSYYDAQGIADAMLVMTGMLIVVGGVLSAVGLISPVGGIFGGAALLVAVQSLEPIVDALKDLAEVNYDRIISSLIGLTGVMTTLGVLVTAMGLVPVAALIGSGSLLLGVQSLQPIADALVTLSALSWEEVEVGLGAMMRALAIIAGGTFLNTLSIIGSASVAISAEPLGVLADSLKKWKDVTVPDGLASSLAQLSMGIKSFEWALVGSIAMNLSALPLGDMADSVRKWDGVKVPATIKDDLVKLSWGISSFEWAIIGGLSIGLGVEGLGNMAGAVKKWDGVEVPATIEDDLTALANGIIAFEWSLMGTGSMAVAIGPLKDMASSVKAWDDVVLPANVEGDLTSLAAGIGMFPAIFSSWSMGAAVQPLKDLAGAIQAWEDVEVPEGLEDGLRSIANGIGAFPDVTMKHNTLKALTERLIDLANALIPWKDVYIWPDFDTRLGRVADGIKSLGNMPSTTEAVNGLTNLHGALILYDLNFSHIPSTFDDISIALGTLRTAAERETDKIVSYFKNLNRETGTSFKEMHTVVTRANGQLNDILSRMASSISRHGPRFESSAKQVIASFRRGLSNGLSQTASAMGNSAVSIGTAIASGIARGLSRGSYAVNQAARTVASNALKTAKNTLGIASPSKEGVWLGEMFDKGFAKGLTNNTGVVTTSSSRVANTALEELRRVLSEIESEFDEDGFHPTIRPVVDLTDAETKLERFNSIFATDPITGGRLGDRSAKVAALYERNRVKKAEEVKIGENRIFNYTQNNHSPKALPKAEIYRRTKNQLSTVKGAIE